ncbi:glutamate 5-kinase [Mongoliitalea daihaiensis]|nr:glutamate 5-kinase [Mongoliitalea daihaiensis]
MDYLSQTIVLKIGSNVLTLSDGTPDLKTLSSLVSQIAALHKKGKKVIVTSSGAVAFGRQEIDLPKKLDPILKKQIFASTGQIRLINEYKALFKKENVHIAQILVTKEDFRDRKHFLNMRSCIQGLLSQDIIPIINENDTVAITELMFTDNDELASLTAAMVNADTLILLTSVDGVYNGPPSHPASELIPSIEGVLPALEKVATTEKSSFGRGGMLTKLKMAMKAADLGIRVIIANGKRSDILHQLSTVPTVPHTVFIPKPKKQSPKKWLAFGEHYFKAAVVINKGAEDILLSQNVNSLLPVGIQSIQGTFAKGDIIAIRNESNIQLGVGKAEYNSEQLQAVLGQKNQKPFIHYDYLYIAHYD